ncbi:MAG: glycosyltransferase family 9 protein [Chitinivibrionales bacterium]|nr:glycosyltransferase family 9 protein [Chitinivibrionales bacterium]
MASFAKSIEHANRRLWRGVLRHIFNNRQFALPLDTKTASSIKRILIFRNDKIGDMIVTTPLFRLLKSNIPGCVIGVVAGKHNHRLIQNMPEVDRVYIFAQNLLSILINVVKIRRDHYDCSINLIMNKSTLNGIMANLMVARGVKFGRYDARYNFYYNCTKNLENINVPMTDLVCGMSAELFGFPYQSGMYHPFLRIPDGSRKRAQEKLVALGINKYILLNVSAGEKKNLIAAALFASVCSEMRKISAVPILILYAPNDLKKARDVLSGSGGNSILLYQATDDLFEIASVVENSWFVISPDTSIVHLAVVFHKPVVGLYAAPERYNYYWRPYCVPFAEVRAAQDKGINSLTAAQIAKAAEQFVKSKAEL